MQRRKLGQRGNRLSLGRSDCGHSSVRARLRNVATVVLLGLIAASGAAQTTAKPNKALEQQFLATDKDRDGALSPI